LTKKRGELLGPRLKPESLAAPAGTIQEILRTFIVVTNLVSFIALLLITSQKNRERDSIRTPKRWKEGTRVHGISQ
jgi:hypothetical protein